VSVWDDTAFTTILEHALSIIAALIIIQMCLVVHFAENHLY